MALPPEFQSVEHLQSVIRRWTNREIVDWFNDLGGEDWDADISTSRGSLRVACTHQDADSLLTTSLRLALFDRVRSQKFQIPMVGIPTGHVEETRKYRPQVMMYFQEDAGDVEESFAPVTGEISFRLMEFTSETITQAAAQIVANKIKTEFSNGGGYLWRKGKHMITYFDKAKGYQLQLLVRNEAEGRQLIAKVLDIRNDVPNWSNCQYKENLEPAAAYPTNPGSDRIYGEVRRLPRRRPIASVRFQFAMLHIWGLTHPKTLVDRSGLLGSPLAA